MKRTLDIVASAIGLLVLSPLLIIIGLLIRLDSAEPALFRQVRVGRGGRTFVILKFRTMRSEQDERAMSLTVGEDPRITRVGSLLRRTKLDELPQLLNVLKGEMSLVGPRPEVPKYANVYPEQAKVWSVRPGITDPTSVVFRNESELLANAENPEEYYVKELLPKKTAMYLDYVKHQSVIGDVRIVLETVLTLISESCDGERKG